MIRTSACLGLLLATTTIAVPVFAQNAAPLPPADTAGEGQDIVVTGLRESLSSAAQIKKNKGEVVDSITAEDIGKLPDPNVAATLTRIPGVQGYRFGGESASPAGNGSGVTIRGLSGQTASRLDGRAFYTAGQREYSLDQASPGIVAGLDVYKNPSSEHIEGAIGGLIDVRTRKPLDLKGLTVSASATLNYNDLAKRKTPEFGGLIADRWNVGGGEMGVLIAGYYQKSTNRSDNTPSNGGTSIRNAIRADSAGYAAAGGNPAFAGRGDVWYLADVPNPLALSAADRQNLVTAVTQVANTNTEEINRERLGFNAAFQWKPSPTLELYAQGAYNRYLYHQRYRFLNASDSRTVRNLVVTPFTLDEQLANRNSNGGTNEVLSGQRLVSGTFLNSTINTVGGDEHSPSRSYIVAGGVKWTPGSHFEVGLDVSYVKAKVVNDNRSVQLDPVAGSTWAITRNLDARPHTIAFDGPSLSSPATFVFNNYANGTHQTNDDDGWAAQLDAKRSFDGGALASLRTGGRFATHTNRYRNYSFSNRYLTTNGLALNATQSNAISATSLPDLLDRSTTNFMDGQTGFPGGVLVFSPDALLGDNVRNRFPNAGIAADASLPENLLSRRDFDEKTYAGYVVADVRLFDDRIKGNAGVRVVRTDTFVRANVTDTTGTTPVIVPRERDASYTKALPTINLTGYITPDLLLRLGFGKGLSRPDLAALNPNVVVNTTTGTGSAGNSDLRPQTADSYDISLEHYFRRGGYVAVNGFYKNVDGFFAGIEQCQAVPTAGAYIGTTANNCPAGQYRITQTVNAAKGYARGVEASVQTFFDFAFLPRFARNFGTSASYTFTDTSTPLLLNGVLVDVPLAFASKHGYSVAGLYEDSLVSARLVYTWRSDFVLFGISANPIDGRYVAGSGTLDGSLNFNLPAGVTLNINAQNLTNQGPDRYVGEPGRFATPLERQHFLNGRVFSIGLRYRFGG